MASGMEVSRNRWKRPPFCSGVLDQEAAMDFLEHRRLQQLPKSFPVGAVYVVEGRGGYCRQFRVSTRRLIMPDGCWIDLPVNPERAMAAPSRLRRQSSRKIRVATGAKASFAPARYAKKSALVAGTGRLQRR
jgi:hypothetical protein